MLLTIFTPAYNRVNLLPRLYSSLVQQKTQNFEWIIVDDGSTDNTKEVIEGFIAENIIPIIYIYKENGGKHLAINKGVEHTQGELFFIVDSDDYLTVDATTLISQYYLLIKNKNDLAGMSFRRGKSENKYIGSQKTFDDFEASALDFRYKHKIVGDMAEVYKTDVIRQYPFPKIDEERFCSEGLVWNRMALQYKILWTSKIIYVGEYLEGGLTDNSFRIRKNSPRHATLFYSELAQMPISFVQKIRATINYWRFAKFVNEPFIDKWKKVNPLLSLIGLPLSLIFILKDS